MRRTHPSEGMARLDRIAQRAGVTLEAWGKHGRQFGYEDRLLRYKPQGKGTFLLEAFVGSSDERTLEATAVCQQRRLEDLILRAAWCEFCESSPCGCSALTRPVPWIEAGLSSREIEPGVYDMQGAPEAVQHAFERLLEDPLIDAVAAGKDTA